MNGLFYAYHYGCEQESVTRDQLTMNVINVKQALTTVNDVVCKVQDSNFCGTLYTMFTLGKIKFA